jgi:hypothetical protein
VSAHGGFAATRVVNDKGYTGVVMNHGDSLHNAVYLIRLNDGDALSGAVPLDTHEPLKDAILDRAFVPGIPATPP